MNEERVYHAPVEDAGLRALLADIESDRVERKSSLADKQKIEQAVCAFANDLAGSRKPGVLCIGVDDAGKPVGLSVTDELLLTLAAIRSDGNVLPLPDMSLEKVTIDGCDVAVVTVWPSHALRFDFAA